MTIATADATGAPWSTPVWFAPDGPGAVVWVSDPSARHSLNIAARPQVAIVIFDSRVEPRDAAGLYMEAVAEELAGAEIQAGVEAFSRESVRQGLAAWGVADVTAPARHRLYRATITARWRLGPGDRRIPLA